MLVAIGLVSLSLNSRLVLRFVLDMSHLLEVQPMDAAQRTSLAATSVAAVIGPQRTHAEGRDRYRFGFWDVLLSEIVG